MKRLKNRNQKILNVHHLDLDGCCSSIVVGSVYKNVEYVGLKYGQVDSYLSKVDFTKYDSIILTDISPENIETFDLSDKIYLLDHHETALKYNNNVNRFVIDGKCAGTLCKTFFENLLHINLSHLKDLVEIVNDYDMWILKTPELAWGMNELFFRYFSDNFRYRFFSGDVKFNNDEIEYLASRRKQFTTTYKNTKLFKMDSIKGGVFVGSEFLNDLCHDFMQNEKLDIIFCINQKTNSCSVRSNLDLHIGNFLQANLSNSGGHKNSGAFKFNDINDVHSKLDMLELNLFKELKK